jgi:multiple sugar transport system substrate-binding protein
MSGGVTSNTLGPQGDGGRTQRRTRRRALGRAAGLAAGAVPGVGALAACGAPQSESGAGAGSQEALATEVIWTSWAVDDLGKSRVQEQADLYHQEFPTARVTIANVPSATYQDKLLSGLAGGSGPDVFRDNPSDAIPLITQGQLQPLDPLFSKTRGTWWGSKDVKPGVMDWGRTRGKQYGLPMGTGAYYDFSINRNLYRTAGVTQPPRNYNDPAYPAWTFERVLEDARRLTKGAGSGAAQYGIDTGMSWSYLLPVVLSWGGEFMNTRTGEFRWHEAPATDAIQWMADLALKHRVAPSGEDATSGLYRFERGRLGLTWSTPNLAMYLLTTVGEQFEWDLVPPPHLPNKKPVLWFYTSWWVLNKASKAGDAAWSFMHWVGGPKGQRVEVEYTWTAPHFSSLDSKFGLRLGTAAAQKSLEVAADFGKYISQDRPELNPRFAESLKVLTPALNQVGSGELTARQAMTQIKPQMDDLLKQGLAEDRAQGAR